MGLIKQFFLTLFLFLQSAFVWSQSHSVRPNYDIIPKPQHIIKSDGYFIFSQQTQVEGISEARLDDLGFMPNANLEAVQNYFNVTINSYNNFGNEGYRLEVTPERIFLKAADSIGVRQGIMSLRQLSLLNDHKIPAVSISDSAYFQHRGLLLDCGRHLFSVKTIQKQIDLLALYKMNVLHWHLTEDQGWRIAIDAYPKLTEIGAFRQEKEGSRYGGFYTKAQIREIVQYAQKRGIEIIPEIELPGHSQAAIAAYPFLSCTGEQVEVANDWGVFKEIYCAGNEDVFVFLETVLNEVTELFPSPYIHIGGDEAPKTRWEKCPKCQKRIKEEGLKDEHELQSYFIQRIQKFLERKGKQIIGWDEIVEGGLSSGAIVQSWRGMEGGKQAVQQGNKAIMSPTSHAYFDYDLDAIDVEKVYAFNPIPEGLSSVEKQRIIGGECNMWTERVPDSLVLEQKIYPRLLAMSEVLWTGPKPKNYDNFHRRLQSQYEILENLNVNFGQESSPMSYEVKTTKNNAQLVLFPYSKEIDLYYRWIEVENGEKLEFQEYKTPLLIEQSAKIEIQPYFRHKKIEPSTLLNFVIHKALNAMVNYDDAFSEFYPADGEKSLVDSKLGSLNFRDGNWQGFYGKDIEVVIDLGENPINYQRLSTHFYQYSNSWILAPKEVEIAFSDDGKNWVDFRTKKSQFTPNMRGKLIEEIQLDFPKHSYRFLLFRAKSFGKLPEWHEAAGSESWLFIDEIILQ